MSLPSPALVRCTIRVPGQGSERRFLNPPTALNKCTKSLGNYEADSRVHAARASVQSIAVQVYLTTNLQPESGYSRFRGSRCREGCKSIPQEKVTGVLKNLKFRFTMASGSDKRPDLGSIHVRDSAVSPADATVNKTKMAPPRLYSPLRYRGTWCRKSAWKQPAKLDGKISYL